LDYVSVNGQPCVAGSSAERHGLQIQRTGAVRYTRDYYGILAAALARLYERSREASVFGSHRPGAVNVRQDLMEALIGDREVESNGRERHIQINCTNTSDEPVGVLPNVIFTGDGQHYQHSDINGGRAPVIDIELITTTISHNRKR
jgi:hypothetical protein